MSDEQPPLSAASAIRASAGVIPVRPGGAVLLQLRDNRPEVGSGDCWGVLGGYVEPGESPEEAAWREIEEEIGVRPDALMFAGHFDHGSLRAPASVTVRLHLYAARAYWNLDDLILGEGQAVDWFAAAEALAVPLAPPLKPAIGTFLRSALYRALADGSHAEAIAPAPLNTAFLVQLELPLRAFVVLIGATAGFGNRLRHARPDLRLTASPGALDRPDAVLLWSQAGAPESENEQAASYWRARLAEGGTFWLMQRRRGGEVISAQRVH